jgi:TonB family protein
MSVHGPRVHGPESPPARMGPGARSACPVRAQGAASWSDKIRAMTLRTFASLAVVLGATLVQPNAVDAQAQLPRVDMNEALRQIAKRVDPVVPPEAAAAQIGGLVVVEATIRATGTVGEVRVLAGERVLHQAAIDAVKQWTFKPFLRNGKPSPVLAILDIKFPDPKADAQREQWRKEADASIGCETGDGPTRLASCGELVRLTDASAPADDEKRIHVRMRHALALTGAGRSPEAIRVIEEAVKIRQARAGGDDADIAVLFGALAVLHENAGDLIRADDRYTAAVRAFDAAIQQAPAKLAEYEIGLRDVLTRHAELKRELGLRDAADAIDKRLATLRTPQPAADSPSRAAPMPLAMRTISGVVCYCPHDIAVAEQDIAAALKAVPATARAWLVNGSWFRPVREPAAASGRIDSSLQVYGGATVSKAGFETGPILFLTWGDPQKPGSKGWSEHPMAMSWLRLNPLTATPASRTDANWPIEVNWSVGDGPITEEDVAALVRHVRDLGAKTAQPGAFDKEVQPLPIRRIWHEGALRFGVELTDERWQTGQRVDVVKAPAGWRVTGVGPAIPLPPR